MDKASVVVTSILFALAAVVTSCGQDVAGSSHAKTTSSQDPTGDDDDDTLEPTGNNDGDASEDTDTSACDPSTATCTVVQAQDADVGVDIEADIDGADIDNAEIEAEVDVDADAEIDPNNEADATIETGNEANEASASPELDASPDVSAGAQDEGTQTAADANDESALGRDDCPLDPAKQSPGVCGCGVADVDSDLDGIADCADQCPLDATKAVVGACGCGVSDVDSDADLTPDCRDACPASASKVDPGHCGCDHADIDSDGDGVLDCRDACPADATRWKESECTAPHVPVGPAYVDITWLSISNVYYELGPLHVLTDGYITRIPMSNFYGGLGGLAYTHTPTHPDVAAVSQVLAALGGPDKVNVLLTGHSHFDHALDTATWSTLTGAAVIGSKTTCFQVRAQGIPANRCTPVNGGEKITLADGVTMRVVRWNHSGDATSNPEQHNPVELDSVPAIDPVTGGLHAGVAESFPNGGGGRGYLFTVDAPDGPYSWFFQNSASATDLQVPIVVDGVDYGAPLDNLRAAMTDAGLASVDLWIGAGGAAVAQLVIPVIQPKAFLPVHWDNFYAPFLGGTKKYTVDRQLGAVLTTAGVQLISPAQYMDKWRLDRSGITAVPNTEVKQALGFTN